MRITQIDGLRGIAALLVMTFHLTTRYGQLYGHTTELPVTLPWGNLGVQLFFAISGFVILMTLRNLRSPLDFVVGRFSRLYPTYWASMFLTALLLALWPLQGHDISAGQVLWNVLMFHELFGIASVSGAYWSLKVELIFYVLMFAFWAFGYLRRPLIVMAAWLVVSIASKFLPTPWTITQFGLLSFIPWFAIGIAVYAAVNKIEDHPWWPAIAALSIIDIAVDEGIMRTTWAVVVLGVMFAGAKGSFAAFGSKPLLFLGLISYPLYLLHEPLSYTFMLRAEGSGLAPVAAVLMAAAGSIALAYGVHALAETPSINWIRSLYKKRAPPAVGAGVAG
jgi:peptidoglycan/LPS O-acetylase OafA/YrhL